MVPVQGLGPATTRFPWTTPAQGDHFCILVRLLAVDDTNPFNNEGQKNVRIVHPAGRDATLTLPLMNTGRDAARLSVRASAYMVAPDTEFDAYPEPMPRQQSRALEWLRSSREAIEPLRDADVRPTLRTRQRAVIEANPRGGFPVSPDWETRLPKEDIVLATGESATVSVSVSLPSALASGTYPLTLNA